MRERVAVRPVVAEVTSRTRPPPLASSSRDLCSSPCVSVCVAPTGSSVVTTRRGPGPRPQGELRSAATTANKVGDAARRATRWTAQAERCPAPVRRSWRSLESRGRGGKWSRYLSRFARTATSGELASGFKNGTGKSSVHSVADLCVLSFRRMVPVSSDHLHRLHLDVIRVGSSCTGCACRDRQTFAAHVGSGGPIATSSSGSDPQLDPSALYLEAHSGSPDTLARPGSAMRVKSQVPGLGPKFQNGGRPDQNGRSWVGLSRDLLIPAHFVRDEAGLRGPDPVLSG